MRYAGGRPLWHLSLTPWNAADRNPVPVLRWSRTTWRKLEAIRDRIMRGVGTDEPWVIEHMSDVIGLQAVSVHYRRPLRIDEIGRMATTDEVKARPGRA